MIVHATHSDSSLVMFKFEVLFVTLFSGLASDPEFVWLLETLLPESNYHICTGLPEDVISQLKFECHTARLWVFPFYRVDHQECKLWFPLERVPKKRIITCYKLLNNIKNQNEKRQSVSPATKARRTNPTSNYPLKFLTPSSRKKRRPKKEESAYGEA